MFEWKKKGLIWSPKNENTWSKEYGQNPNAVVFEDKIRIYFSSRKKNTDSSSGGYISYIFFVDVDKTNPSKIIYEQKSPLLVSKGSLASSEFDEFGTMPGSIVKTPERNEIRLYYVGWTRKGNFPYSWSNGFVKSLDGGSSFNQNEKKQILTNSYQSPYLHACPRVYYFGKDNWVMWYAAGLEWYKFEGRQHPIYVIKTALSKDGIHWEPVSYGQIEPIGRKECQSSPSVIKIDGTYHMFFSFRDVLGQSESEVQYQIGYASSKDLIHWSREDFKCKLEVSEAGWDSQAVCYPHVVEVGEKIYMFYSGSQFGSAGFGYAELER